VLLTDVERRENGAELAGGEGVEGLEGANQLGAGYTALTVERINHLRNAKF